jgi:UDP-N-acetylmuramoyl-tripeptide--D-alanyl-D-alanine ligase
MIATVLRSKKRGHAAPASFNNAIGVPLTLLAVDPADEFVVVEIGTNHPGEVAALGRIAQPNVAVITSIGEEHLEFFGDIESVAREEFSLLGMMGGSSGSSPAPMSRTGGGRGFVALSEQAARHAPGGTIRNHHTLTYGIGEQADLRAVDLVMDGEAQKFKVNGRFEYRLPVLGAHNVVNVLAAIVIGSRLRLTHEEMAAAVTDIRLRPMRMERSTAGGITFINDAYNANPSSMRAAFNVMDGLSEAGRKVFILGDMRELGDQADRCHRAVGCAAGRSTAHVIIAVGAHARVVADGATATAGTTKRIYSFPTIDALADRLSGLIEPGAVVLLKASRAIGLERLIEVLEQAGRPLAAK